MPVSVFCVSIFAFYRKGMSNGVQTEGNLREDLSWTKRNPEDLELKSGTLQGGHEVGGRTPHPRGLLVAPPTYFFCLYILLYPRNIKGSHDTTFPPPQPSIPVRSHLGAFSGNLPKGESITEGFYINTIASPMKRE